MELAPPLGEAFSCRRRCGIHRSLATHGFIKGLMRGSNQGMSVGTMDSINHNYNF